MIHLLGAVLLAAGGAGVGFQAAAGLRRRVWALNDLSVGLALLGRELELNAPPLPELMAALASAAPGTAGALFRRCALGLEDRGEEPFSALWSRAVAAERPLRREDRQILLPLGQNLGRYDVPEQVRAVHTACRLLEETARRAAAQRDRQGRVYQLLGVSGGMFLMILLL